MMEKVVEKQGV